MSGGRRSEHGLENSALRSVLLSRVFHADILGFSAMVGHGDMLGDRDPQPGPGRPCETATPLTLAVTTTRLCPNFSIVERDPLVL